MQIDTVHLGDCREHLRAMAAAGIKARMCVTSPPYWGLRDYGADGQIGLEETLDDWLDTMLEVFALVREVLTDDGTLWLNLGDGYASSGGAGWQGKNGQRADRRFTAQRDTVALRNVAKRPPTGLKPKDLMGQPWRVAFALQADGWWLRQDIVWHKPNPMPESVKDRFCKAHEYLFLLSKSERYYFDQDAVKEPSSPDSHARYARGRSDDHKWADGGPGDQTIARTFDHMKKPVSGWDTGPGNHSAIEHATSPKYRDSEGHETKQGLAASERKYRPRKGTLGPKDEGRAEQGLRDSTRFGRGAGWRDLEPGVNPKAAEDDAGSRQNSSFSAAVKDLVPDRNKRSVWTIPPEPFSGAHFATYPTKLIEPCVLAGSQPGDLVLDPFLGSGTTAQVAEALGRHWIGFELQADYLTLINERLTQRSLTLE